jgi:hypothetical protein
MGFAALATVAARWQRARLPNRFRWYFNRSARFRV